MVARLGRLRRCYTSRFAPQFPELARLVAGVVARNEKNILTDPYANAFTEAYRIWERKWEVDSLAYPVEMAYAYWVQTQRRDLFTAKLHYALIAIVRTYACEQRHAAVQYYRESAGASKTTRMRPRPG